MVARAPLLWCLCLLIYVHIIESRVHHGHRHERSRLRRQHQYEEPNIYVIEDEGGGTLESGDWGAWSQPSPCSRSCGGGVSFQTRECSPYATSACYGGKKRYFSCNTEECPGGENFRAEQCSEYNRIPFQGITYTWIPYKKAEEKCVLNCMPVGERFYYRHKEQVVDGTPCTDETRDICVDGKCLEVGCDNLLGSRMKEDDCRVCGGDGSSCITKSGVIDRNAQRIGYEDLFLIPSGATNINVRERRPSNNYLAVRNKTGYFYLNGNWKIDYSQSLRFAGTVFIYERRSFPFIASESLTAVGPTTEPLFIAMLYQEPNPGIEYTYSVPKGSFQETPNEGYVWAYDSYTDCNVTCGQGYQTRRVWCSQNRKEVNIDLCDSGSEPTSINICSKPACPAKWFTSGWSRCSAPCGEKGTRTRQVICQQEVGLGAVRVDGSLCEPNSPEPASVEECQETGPCPTWHIGPWKPCDHLCGEGKQTRQLHCYKKVNGLIELLEGNDCHEQMPEAEKKCNLRPCEGLDWITSDWSGCSEKCGVTFETRTAQCANEKGIVFNDTMCQENLKPELIRNCTITPCASQWFASQWSPCSAKCGTGIQSRDVFCVSLEKDTLNKVDDSKCDPKLKYENTKECKVEEECKGEWFAGPFGECSKPCGGGIKERKVMCIKNNKTVNLSECDEDKIILRIENCNTEACGEGEARTKIIPLETTQTIMEEDSEECDYDYSDYEDTTDEGISTSGILKFTDEIEDGSGFFTDEFMTTGSEGKTTPEDSTSEVTLTEASSSIGSSETAGILQDNPATTSSSGSTETSTLSSGDSSSSESSSDKPSSDKPSSPETTGSESGSSVESTSPKSTGSELSSSSDESTSIETTKSSTDTSESSPQTSSESSSPQTSSEASSAPSSETTESSSSSISQTSEVSSMATSSSDSDKSTAETSLTGASSTESVIDMISSTITSLMAKVSSSSESDSTTEVSGGTLGSTLLGSTESSGTTDSTTISSGETSSSGETDTTFITSTDSSVESSSSSVTDEPTTDWSSTIFNYTTVSPVDAVITKEQTVKKCKKKKGKSKCSKTKFGCCPDKTTEAKGPFGKGCSIPKTCKESKNGCCLDGVSAAKGPKYKGCPKSNCDETLFGCCKDGTTPSNGNNYEGCPEEPTTIVDCMKSKWGCCPDGILSAMGPKFAGCVCDTCIPCGETQYGCCPDNLTTATGKDYAGCNIIEKPDCDKSKHGCCPNGIKAAEGPDNKGCKSCKETEFGCCPDGIKSARGDNGFGCDPLCAKGRFGCCPDNDTMAHGPNYEGCCLSYQYGCCPDHITPAQGPNNQGCDCQNTNYGCCPDNKTPAKGPNKEGCGCQHSEHGCCPDNSTPAEGPEYQGCSCHTFQFGCCPDGVTKVSGPYDSTCRCEATPHGCCSDGVTTKLSATENCSCETTKYGCCPDGYTEAQGEKFEGCENVSPKGEICSLNREPGECRDFRVSYYYDMKYGGCSKFWYGGCGGNLNRFNTLEECQNHCIAPPGKDACTLPMSRGICSGQHPSWYFDSSTKRCQEFIHSGCLGNNNRFDTREECENLCGTQDHLDVCEQSYEPGPCQGQYNRWFFNKKDKTCQEFVYGGCKGTKNNFMTEEACKYRCMRPPTSLTEQCFAPKLPGTCSEKIPKWFFSTPERKCMPFYYTGCDGNGNSFDSLEECEENCPLPKDKDICTLPAVGGGCSNYTARYYYDTAKKSCQHFYYGGCEGNENNFISENECNRKCNKKSAPEPPARFTPEMCTLSQEQGNCDERIPRYSFDYSDGVCKQFIFTGCGGNGNNFETEDECQRSCENIIDRCTLPRVVGPCDRWTPQYYYEQSSDECRSFSFGGCLGNSNRFNTIEECESYCKRNTQPKQPDLPAPPPPPPENTRPYSQICHAPMDPGPCLEQIPSWHYDFESAQCKPLTYGGCEGNGNRFVSEEQCERQCGEYRVLDACTGYPVSGTCYDSQQKYFYDSEKKICSPFTYSGCGGTANRFSTVEECESICLRNIEPKVPKGQNSQGAYEICNQPLESGTCENHITRYMYDDRERNCISFLYTGCGGNLNNFETNEECVDYCGLNEIDAGPKQPEKDCNYVEVECRLLRCDYGIERWVDQNDCEACRCHDPCQSDRQPCEDPSLCRVERVEDERTGETQYTAVCGDVIHDYRDVCITGRSQNLNCETNCDSDTDCPSQHSCCHYSCGRVCVPAVPNVTYGPDAYDVAVQISEETPSEATEEQGNLAVFECIAHGSPVPKVEWKRNGETINPSSSSKFRISNDGKLEIIGLEASDEGQYTCEANNGGGAPATRDYYLKVQAGTPRQAQVVNNPDEKELIATMNRPVVLRCFAIGFPAPTIYWWRGEKVLSHSEDGIEQKQDNTLYIQAVTPKHLGYYTCHVYNGAGSAASFTLTLKMYGPIDSYDPNDITYNPFLLPSPKGPPVEDRPRPPPYRPQDKVPVMVNISQTIQEFAQGNNITLNCAILAGNPPPEFTWLKDETEVVSTERIIVHNNRLILTNAQPEDSGVYTCIGENGYSQAKSSVRISVPSSVVPANCTDSPYFANCQLIVQANYCNHQYYAKFCCKSCTEAGKFDTRNYRSRRSLNNPRIKKSHYILPSRRDKHSPKFIKFNQTDY